MYTSHNHYPTYLYDLIEDIIDHSCSSRRIFDVRSDCVQMVQRHQDDVTRLKTERHLVFEGHGHQIVQLKLRKQWK